MDLKTESIQRETCRKYGADWLPARSGLKVGIALNAKSGLRPLNGLRHHPVDDVTGWYIWAGEGDPSDDPEFFVPLHVEHIEDWCPEVIRFLGLPPGWRFLVAQGYEDVWKDLSLLEV